MWRFYAHRLMNGLSQTKRRTLHFLHIRKCAGTQIISLNREFNQRQNSWRIFSHEHRIKLQSLPRGSDYFFSIRNPISRFVSGFEDRQRMGQPGYFYAWTPKEKVAFSIFPDANSLAEALFLIEPVGQAAVSAMAAISHCSTLQMDWFSRSSNFLAVRPPVCIIRQEKFDQDFGHLLRALGVDVTLDLTSEAFRSNLNPNGGHYKLSELAMANLKKWYAKDFELYARCEDWMAGNGKGH